MEKFSQEYIELLSRKYREGSLSETEMADFKSWYSDLSTIADLDNEVNNYKSRDEIKNKIDAQLNFKEAKSKISYQPWKWRIAAAALVFIGCSVFFILAERNNNLKTDKEIVLKNVSVQPGRNLAYLTLANGTTVKLDTAKEGEVIALNGPQKTQNNQLVYSPANKGDAPTALVFNKLVTPAGGQYKVVLSDGTKVWLDAASKLTYPQRFNDTVRRVTLEGQAYFEVAHENSRPFRITAGSQEVTVLGTHFNINAYRDEPKIVTTLVQGMVRVTYNHRNIIIKPGEKAVSDSSQNSLVIKNANLTTELAWINGMIQFQDAPLPEIMRQVSRWYNIKIRYVGTPSKDVFTGGFSRDGNLASLLDILKSNGIPYQMKQNGDDKILEIGKL